MPAEIMIAPTIAMSLGFSPILMSTMGIFVSYANVEFTCPRRGKASLLAAVRAQPGIWCNDVLDVSIY